MVTGHQVTAINIPATGNLLHFENRTAAIVRFSEVVQHPEYKYRTLPFMFREFSESRRTDMLLFGEVISESDKFYEFSW